MTKVQVPSLEDLDVLVDAPPRFGPKDLTERLHQELRADSPRRELEVDERLDWGDEVDCDLVLRIDGQIFPGAVCRYRGLELRPILALPGFVEALVEARVSALLSFPLRLPLDYPIPGLAGKEAMAHVRVHAAWEVDMPELDDKDALVDAELGESIEDAMASVAELLEQEAVESLIWETTRCVLDVFGQRVEFEVSDSLLDVELQARWESSDGPVLHELGFGEAERRRALELYVSDAELRSEMTRQFRQLAGLNALIEAKGIIPSKERAGRLLESVADYLGLTLAETRLAVTSDAGRAEVVGRYLHHLAAVEYLLGVAKVHVLESEGPGSNSTSRLA